MPVDSNTDRISAIGMLRCGSRTSPATDTIGVNPRYAKMMPPADTAPAMPAKPNGAKPCAEKLSRRKKHSSATTTASGTTNLNTPTRLLAREDLHAEVVQQEENREDRKLHKPAQRRRRLRTGLRQLRKPRGRVLPARLDLDRDQAGKRDQRDQAHQVTEQCAVRIHRIAHHAAGARQRGAE